MKFQYDLLSPERKERPSNAGLSLFALATALLVLVASSPAASFKAAGQLPELTLDKTSVDYGEVFKGEDLLTLFHARNTGQELLQLSETPLLPPKQATSASFTGLTRPPLPVSASLLIPSPT